MTIEFVFYDAIINELIIKSVDIDVYIDNFNNGSTVVTFSKIHFGFLGEIFFLGML